MSRIRPGRSLSAAAVAAAADLLPAACTSHAPAAPTSPPVTAPTPAPGDVATR
jgi:hypothetical protein